MKQLKKRMTIFLLLSFLAMFSFPSSSLGEEANMQNEAGIEFENDYEPSSSSDELDLPSGTTESSISVTQPSTLPKSGGKSFLPATGEKQSQVMLISGGVLLAILGIIFGQQKRKVQ